MKPETLAKLTLCTLAFLCVSACGGGGGGGGGSSSRGMRVLHGAIDTSPMNAISSAKPELLQTARFAEVKGYSSLPKGVQQLALKTKTGSTIATADVDFTGAERFSFLLYGNREDLGLRGVVIPDNSPEKISGDMSVVKAVHGLAGASGIDVTVANKAISLAIGFSTASPYVEVPAGVVTLDVKRTADKKTVFSGPITLEKGKPYTVFVTGEVDYLVIAPVFQD